MSEISHVILNKILEKLSTNGFKLYKSKNSLIKNVGDIEYGIDIKFDGRGGLSNIKCLKYYIYIPSIRKILSKCDSSFKLFPCLSGEISYIDFENKKLVIPWPCSNKASDLCNKMDFSALSNMSFEEKYPSEKIDACIEVVLKIIEETIYPFFNRFPDYQSIYDIYEQPKLDNDTLNPLEVGKMSSGNWHSINILFIVLLSKKIGRPIPKYIVNHLNESKTLYNYISNQLEFVMNYNFI